MHYYIVIPIFSDPLLQPLHGDNELSLLYVKEENKESEILSFNSDTSYSISIVNIYLLSLMSFENSFTIKGINSILANI